MKNLLIIAQLLTITCSAQVAVTITPGIPIFGPPGSAFAAGVPYASPYLLEQDFEGTGYDNGGGWTEGGVVNVNEDYTSTIIDGSQSLNVALTASTGYTESPDVVVGGGRILYGYLKLRFASLPASSMSLFAMYDTANNQCLRVRLSSTGTLGVLPGVGTEVTTVGTLAINTTYHVWFSASARGVETALASTARVSFSTDGVRPTSGDNYAIDDDAGGATDDPSSLRIGTLVSSTTVDVIYDKVRLNNSIIGDNPQ